MAILAKFKPIAEAMLKSLEGKDPDTILFVVGKKSYKVKEVKKHIQKEDRVADTLITFALKTNGCKSQTRRGILLSPDEVPLEQIQATANMFLMG